MILTIFLKELKDTLRDRRTIMMMVVIPILIFPLILNVFIGISSSFEKDAANKTITIGIIGEKNGFISNTLSKTPDQLGKCKIKFYTDSASLIRDIQIDSIQMGIYSSKKFEASLIEKKPTPIICYFNGTDIGIKSRAEKYISYIEEKALNKRFKELKLDPSKVKPIVPLYVNIASDKEMLGKIAGGILPYIFIAFGFIGCMYPAIDLFTGEKERGTIETLLTTPISRLQILFGKMGVVVLSGLLASSFALIGLFLSIEMMDVIKNEQLLNVVHSIMTVKFILTLFLLLIPLTVFFAGLMIPIAVYAKTFKEAQSIITPLNIVVVLPAMIGFFPGIELNLTTASIPVINVVLSTKELVAGTLNLEYLLISFLVMGFLALISVFISYKQFGKESNILT